MTIAVTTPTGHVGSRVVRLLLQAGIRPRLLLRDPGKLDQFVQDQADFRTGDLADAAFISAATAGAETLLWIVPESFTATDPIGEMTRMGENAAEAVRRNGIRRVVMVSSVGAEKGHGAGLIDGLARSEEQLAATDADLAILRCGFFFTNLLGNLDELKSGALSTTGAPDVPMPWVDPGDIAEVAAVRLLADWSGRTKQGVFGPEDLSWQDVVRVLGGALGTEVKLNVISDDDQRAALRSAGMSQGAVEGMVGMTTGLRDGFTPELSRDYLATTPTTLAAWAYANLRPLVRS